MQQVQKPSVQPMLMNVTQVAQALGVSRGTVYQMILTANLPVVLFGRKRMVRPDALKAWLQDREQQL
ncbi:helix-turn-helix domain-containing protein [Dictyobacter aurantiacus]|uniref:Helix-turn-helix domain-containing protein n=1 Tax=Dictyobacter aurantiacus TaxID=1936993 RepID=A0A401ZD08_9CHLR|nr:helix-turn-helix domain-containing protein [Dictyobacter aurantiacus]GCE04767.1 hypothetical protein KDAU_20960 [Dictyobacter aurantiacus]